MTVDDSFSGRRSLGTMTPELREEMLVLAASNGPEWAQVVDAYRRGLRLPREIAATGAGRGDVRNVDRIVKRIRYLLEDEHVSTGPARAEKVQASMRAWLYKPGVSAAAQDHLRLVLSRLAAISGPSSRPRSPARPRLGGQALRQVDDVAARERELRAASGVYVYSYPTQLKDERSGEGRHLFKVGKTTQGAWKRVLEQARMTGAPEDPVLLRVYVTDVPDAFESTFHRMLVAADHTRQVTNSGGQEWFETSLTFLDEIAGTLGLKTIKSSTPA